MIPNWKVPPAGPQTGHTLAIPTGEHEDGAETNRLWNTPQYV
jgi:hypothetical protein